MMFGTRTGTEYHAAGRRRLSPGKRKRNRTGSHDSALDGAGQEEANTSVPSANRRTDAEVLHLNQPNGFPLKRSPSIAVLAGLLLSSLLGCSGLIDTPMKPVADKAASPKEHRFL